jgi:hypothetical protein
VAQPPVEIVAHDPAWPARFEEERASLARVLAPLDASRPALAALVGIGYLHFPYRADVMHRLCKPSDDVRTHHLHRASRERAVARAPGVPRFDCARIHRWQPSTPRSSVSSPRATTSIARRTRTPRSRSCAACSPPLRTRKAP